MLGDIVIYHQESFGGGRGSRRMMAAASAATILAGEPVVIVAGASTVVPNQSATLLTQASPYVPYNVTGTGFVGIAQTSTTASTAGGFDVAPANTGVTYLVTATTPSLISTQSKYDALVGARVVLYASPVGTTVSSSGFQYYCNLTDSALNGFIVRPLDIYKFPNKVAVSPVAGIIAVGA